MKSSCSLQIAAVLLLLGAILVISECKKEVEKKWDTDRDGDFDLDDLDCDDHYDDDHEHDHDEDDEHEDVAACKEYHKKYKCYKRVWEGCHSCMDMDQEKVKCERLRKANWASEDGKDADTGSDYCDHDEDEDDDGDYDMQDIKARYRCCKQACDHMYDDDDDTDGDLDDPIAHRKCVSSCKREFDVCHHYMADVERCERGKLIKQQLHLLDQDADDDISGDHNDPYETVHLEL